MESSEYLQPYIDVIVPRAFEQVLGALSSTEQILYLVWSYTGAINNGGHSSFFYNSYGQFASETVAALHALGAGEYAQQLSKAIDQFPLSFVPSDIEERNEIFNLISQQGHEVMSECDSRFYELGDEELMNRALSFWREHAS